MLLGLWVLATGAAELRREDLNVAFRLMLLEVPLVIWWVLARSAVGSERYAQMGAALAAALVASSFGAQPLRNLWFGLPALGRRIGLAVLAMLIAGAGWLLWLATEVRAFAPAAAVAVAAIVLIHRPPAAALGPRAAKFRYYAMAYPGVIVLICVASGDRVALPVGGTWLLTGVAIAVCALAARRQD